MKRECQNILSVLFQHTQKIENEKGNLIRRIVTVIYFLYLLHLHMGNSIESKKNCNVRNKISCNFGKKYDSMLKSFRLWCDQSLNFKLELKLMFLKREFPFSTLHAKWNYRYTKSNLFILILTKQYFLFWLQPEQQSSSIITTSCTDFATIFFKQ